MAVDFVRGWGARAIEGYPIITKNMSVEELLVGTVGAFADGGVSVVSRPTPRSVAMRLDFLTGGHKRLTAPSGSRPDEGG